MTLIDARTVPADPTSQQRLEDAGYRYRTVDMADVTASAAFVRAVPRGFLDPAPTDGEIARMRDTWVPRRNIGVYEADAADEALPVATVNSWVAPTTIPGGELPMWAISAVTVAATHRRRGIARNLLEGELRAAASAGVPMAGLTVSEATIYGRYGFGPAIPAARIAVDTRRAGWIGADAPGRLEYVEREQLADDLGVVHERARLRRAGQIPGWEGRWLGMAGLGADDAKKDPAVRGVRYLDAEGVLRGAVAYSLKEQPGSFRSVAAVRHLAAETDEALRALWGFVVNHDLVDRVEVDLRPVDDPIVHLVADQRAVEVVVHDHGWLRVLDVPAALEARRYAAAADLVLSVDDPYGFAAGTWRLRIDEHGTASVQPGDAEPDLSIGVAALSSLYAGGVSAAQLAAAGRIAGDDEAVRSLGLAFRVEQAPLLGIWY